MSKRINIVLPDETLAVLNQVAPKGNRSRLISEAVMQYISDKAKANVAARVKEGAKANAIRDLNLAEDWFSVDEGAWEQTKRPARRKK